jgi:hypothetical protein
MNQNIGLDYLLVLPVGCAVAFMLWVFWNLSKQINKR